MEFRHLSHKGNYSRGTFLKPYNRIYNISQHLEFLPLDNDLYLNNILHYVILEIFLKSNALCSTISLSEQMLLNLYSEGAKAKTFCNGNYINRWIE